MQLKSVNLHKIITIGKHHAFSVSDISVYLFLLFFFFKF